MLKLQKIVFEFLPFVARLHPRDIPALYKQGCGRQDEPTDAINHSTGTEKAHNHLPKTGAIIGR